MFDLAWSEIALILLVALVVIGPKELPNAVRGLADFIRKARRMAGEFQVHVDEMMRETKLDEVKKQIDEVRSGIYEMKRDVETAVDEHGIRDAFKDPFADTGSTTPTTTSATTPAGGGASATQAPTGSTTAPGASVAPPPPKGPPAFVPPAFVPPGTVAPAASTPAASPAAAARDTV
jgi:sec-independent protein translocase protein TatB